MEPFGNVMSSMVMSRMPSMSEILDKILRDRASNLVQGAISQYRYAKSQVKPDQSVNLVCTIGSLTYDVHRVAWSDGQIEVASSNANNELIVVYAPVELVSFTVMVLNKPADTPAREIGFKAIMEKDWQTA